MTRREGYLYRRFPLARQGGLSGQRTDDTGKRQHVDGAGPRRQQSPGAGRRGLPRGQYVVDQQHPAIRDRPRPARNHGEGASKRPASFRRPQTAERRRAPNALQGIGHAWEFGLGGNRLGQQASLVVSAHEEPGPMQRHRYDQVRLGNKFGAGAHHPTGEGGGGFGTVAMLETEDRTAAGIVVGQRGPGPGERRRLAHAGAAQRVRSGIVLERQAASGAPGWRQEPQRRPTRDAGRARFVHEDAADEALRRQHQIEREPGGPLQRTGLDLWRLWAIQDGGGMCHITSMSDSMTVFNRRHVRRHRDRAARAPDDASFLIREVAGRLVERLDDVIRKFPMALDLGCRDGEVGRLLAGRGGVETLVQCDFSVAMAEAAARRGLTGALGLAADEEALPFVDGAFDLILSAGGLHWVNDLPGTLLQVRRALKPDGLFLAAMFGGDTLKELRQALADAEIAGEGGLSPRVSPFADVEDLGGLLQRAGFRLPVVDRDTITVSYGDPMRLMADLAAMGESNASAHRRQGMTRRATLARAAERYRELFQDKDGRMPATFQVIYLTAWAPGPDQPKALRPGSAKTRLADALGTVEIPAGDKARP